ncbi:MAG: FkbM family methyltransferase [Rhodospirillaceae bacterium]|jgi:FkbM family methyltransferase
MTFRRRLTYFAHLFKAVFKQHHLKLRPLLMRLIPNNSVVIDVGGHAGQFAKLFTHIVKQGHAFTFEPGQYALSILRYAIKFNFINNVTITPLGLSDKCESQPLVVPIKSSGVVRFGLSSFGKTENDQACEQDIVNTTTLDDFCSKQKLDRIDFIKADIEGWELRMLEGGRQCLSKYRPALMIEVSEQHLNRAGDSVHKLWEFMQTLNYKPHITNSDCSKFNMLAKPQEGDIFWLPAETL